MILGSAEELTISSKYASKYDNVPHQFIHYTEDIIPAC